MGRQQLHHVLVAAAVAAGAAFTPVAALAWEPTKPVEFIVPAGTGGGADQMARFIQGVVAKNNLMKQPLIVVNKSGGAGAEGFLDVKNSKGDPNKIIITLSNLFTTPLATGVPFNWKDLTPVAMLALDEFVLWVNAETPYKTAGDYMNAVKAGSDRAVQDGRHRLQAGGPDHHRRAGKGAGKKLTYIPFKGGGAVAVQLVGKHIDSTVNNPIEAVAHWRSGAVRPLCVFDSKPHAVHGQGHRHPCPGSDIPTCKDSGVDVEYTMLRGIFMPPGVTKEQVDFYVDLFKKVRETPEWKKFMEDAALQQHLHVGPQFVDWLTKAEATHKGLMQEAGFIAK